MSISRRDILKSAGASLSTLALPSWAATSSSVQLTASAFTQAIRPGGRTNVWGFNGKVPGPMLRMRKGETARIAVTNKLPPGNVTTVHWHGMRVPNAMDGVPLITQDPISVGETFNYTFPLVDSGTFWYHPHQASFEQVARGMIGGFVVEEEKPIAVDRDEVWVLNDFKVEANGRQVEDFGRVESLGGGGRLGNLFMLNGVQAGASRRLEMRKGERIRLRLINASSARIYLLDFVGHKPRVVAYDGQAVTPHEVAQGLLTLGPGSRVDLVLDGTGDPGQNFAIVDRRDRGYRIATIAYSKRPALRSRLLGDPIQVTPNELPEPDPAKATEHFIVFEGGLLGKPTIGLVDGQVTEMSEVMTKRGLYWTMNYVAEHENALLHTPLFSFRKGEHVVLKMVNETEFEHPMHLHGHFFRVLRQNDRPTAHREWRDTVMVTPRGSVDVAFVADNEGEWMFHCHILEHAAGGMMGTVTVG